MQVSKFLLCNKLQQKYSTWSVEFIYCRIVPKQLIGIMKINFNIVKMQLDSRT